MLWIKIFSYLYSIIFINHNRKIMKKQLLLLLVLVLGSWSLTAQVSFFDDFESYNVGDLIAGSSPNWTTWSGGVPAEDAPVSDAQAFSGNNSIYFLNTNGQGGPADVVLPFEGKYTDGTFELYMQVYVESGTGAYFNLQAEEQIGVTWALEFYFQTDGALIASNVPDGQLMISEYNHDEWIDFRLEIDLTSNNWQVFVNDLLLGTFSNSINSVASLDLFPFVQGATSSFYVDDIGFSYEPFVIPNLDAAISQLTMRNRGLTGQEFEVRGELRNLGLTPITSATLSYEIGGNTVEQELTGINIPSLETYNFSFSELYPITVGPQTMEVTVSEPNGQVDENPGNDTKTITITGYTPAPGKRVVMEEATGTWCGWCPRGTVNMDRAAADYPDHFVGVAVHNGDPMVVPAYDNGITGFPGFTGFPGVVMDRIEVIDPSEIEERLLTRVTTAPVAFLSNSAEWDAETNELKVTVHAEFQEAVTGDYRLSLVVTENGVTGLGSGFAQVNFYSGGGSGPMGGYENLPSPVPASQMVYDYVARAIVGDFNGVISSLPGVIEAGETHSYEFTYTLPTEYNYDEIKLIGFLINPQGEIDNAGSTTIDEAIANGTVNTNDFTAVPQVKVFPNPFSESTHIQVELPETKPVQMRVFNSTGMLVATRDYGQLQGEWVLPFIATDLPNGVYHLQIWLGDQAVVRKVSLNR